MNIAIIHPNRPGDSDSGVSLQVTKLIKALRSRGHQVTIFCAPLGTNSSEEDVSYRKLSSDDGYPYQAYLQRDKAIRNNRDEFGEFDVVHTHPRATIPAIAQIGSKTDTGTVATLHSYSEICPKEVNQLQFMDMKACKSNGILKCSICALGTLPSIKKAGFNIPFRMTERAGRFILQHRPGKRLNEIDQFHVLSPHMREKYTEFGFPNGKFSIIPGMVDDRFIINHQSSFVEPYQILSVGRLSKRKGSHKLVPLLHKLHNETSYSFELTIVGSGAMGEKIEQQVNRFGLEGRVSIKGHIEHEKLPKIYANHDIFLYPSEFDEPFGLVFLEAMATGTPVISTDVGSVKEIIKDGGIVANKDIESLSDSIEKIVSNNELSQISKKARERSKDFRQEEIIDQYEKMYKKAAK